MNNICKTIATKTRCGPLVVSDDLRSALWAIHEVANAEEMVQRQVNSLVNTMKITMNCS